MTGSKKQYFLRELHALPRNNRQSYPQKNAQKSKVYVHTMSIPGMDLILCPYRVWT